MKGTFEIVQFKQKSYSREGRRWRERRRVIILTSLKIRKEGRDEDTKRNTFVDFTISLVIL
jgi:hypothetical protein